MTNIRTRRVATGALTLALAFGAATGLTASGGDDVSKDTFKDQLVDSGISEAIASCIVDDVYEKLDKDEIKDVYQADTEEEAGEAGKTFTEITTACATAEAGGAETTLPTETTEAGG